MEAHEQVRWYDPISKDPALYSKLSNENKELYDLHKANKDFSKLYLERTGRHWLSFFPRKPPGHFMHKADYVGQVSIKMVVGAARSQKRPQENQYTY